MVDRKSCKIKFINITINSYKRNEKKNTYKEKN